METDYINKMAEFIMSVIRSGFPVSWSWGPGSFRATAYKGMAALRFLVNGFIHKGDVVVAYNAGPDAFEVYCLGSDDTVVSSRDDVYLDELVNAIDKLVEKEGSDDDYDTRRREYLKYNLISVQIIPET